MSAAAKPPSPRSPNAYVAIEAAAGAVDEAETNEATIVDTYMPQAVTPVERPEIAGVDVVEVLLRAAVGSDASHAIKTPGRL
jgi:hypothetical protein